MVELFETELMDDGRRSSKGNQLKWESGGIWFKADYLGYEGLSEFVISSLLEKSSLEEAEYVKYGLETIRYKNNIFTGCRSRDFAEGYMTITLERLFKTLYGKGLNEGIYSIGDHTERLKFLVDQVERTTGIQGFGLYMSKMLTIDSLFLNEDRHTHNISILWDGNREFRLCPIYDNGAALMSDTRLDYPLGLDIYTEKKRVKPKLFCDSFEEQLDIAESLYGKNISFNWKRGDVDEILSHAGIYEKTATDRVRDLLIEQRREHSYLFLQ